LCDSAQFGIDGRVSPTGPIRLMEYFSHKLSQFPSGVNIQLSCCGEDILAYLLAQVEQMNNPFSQTGRNNLNQQIHFSIYDLI